MKRISAAMAGAPPPPPGSTRKREELETQRVRSIGRIFLSSFGECVVRADPASAHSLLRSSVLTPEENNAFVALRPAFGQCLDEGRSCP
jgi:hypothetical protein